MNNASLIALVVKQLVTDNLVVVKTDGMPTKQSAQALGAAATSLAIVMKKDRRKMFRYIRFWALRMVTSPSPNQRAARA